MTKPGFAVRHLTHVFGQFQLGPIDFSLPQQAYWVLLGPTGCGKSSLLRILAGLEGRKNQTIFLDDQDLGKLPPQARRIGYVSQGNDLFPHLTVEQNLAFGQAYLRQSATQTRQQLQEYLERFQLQAKARQSVFTLSGGEQRKVAMARSLIARPQLLLLDEPLSMLDPNSREEVLALLQSIHRDFQLTMLHVTHDRQEAWSVAQHCLIMNQGMILQSGSVDDVFRQPQSRIVAEFTGGKNIFPAMFSGKTAILDWGQVTLPQPTAAKAGFVMIRPEHVRLALAAEKNQAKGRLLAIRDFGQYWEYEFLLARNVRMIMQALTQVSRLKAGAANVRLAWHPRHLHYWPEGGSHD